MIGDTVNVFYEYPDVDDEYYYSIKGFLILKNNWEKLYEGETFVIAKKPLWKNIVSGINFDLCIDNPKYIYTYRMVLIEKIVN